MAGANAEYAINIAAQLQGDETLSQLDQMSAELMGAGKDAQFFQDAIRRVTRELDAAAAASAAADAALAAGATEYKTLESAANQAAKKVERLALKGDVLSRDYLAAARASEQATAAVNAQASALTKLEADAAGASREEERLTKTLSGVKTLNGHVNQTITDQAKEWRVLGGVLGQLPGPLGSIGRGFAAGEAAEAKFAARFGESAGLAAKVALGIAGVTAALIAVGIAFGAAAIKAAAWAVGLADTHREAGLATEAFNAMNPTLAGLDFAALSKDTGQSVAELQALSKTLQGAGVTADRMGTSLRAAALAETALGKGASQEYSALEQAATEAQKAVDEAAKKSGGVVKKELTDNLTKARAAADKFANAATGKLGGIVARQMQGLGAQAARLESNIGDIFGGLDIDPVLAGVSKLVELFDKNSAAGKALKFLFDTIFQPIIDQAETAATVVEAFYLGVMIGAMKFYIAIKPTVKAVEEFFGLDGNDLAIDFKTITKIGEELAPVFLVVAGVIGGAVVAAFVAIGAVIAAQAAVWYGFIKLVSGTATMLWDIGKQIYTAVTEPFRAISAFLSGEIDFATLVNRLIMNTVNVVLGLAGTVASAFVSLMAAPLSYLTGIDLSGMGRNLIMGFVHGITGALGAVVSAVTNVMGSAISAAKGVLGIHSPSTVMKDEVAGNTVDGFVGGVEDGTADANDAMAALVSPQPANDNALTQAQMAGDADTVERLQAQGAAGGLAMQTAQPESGAGVAVGAAQQPGDGKPGDGAAGVHIENLYLDGKKASPEQAEALADALTDILQGRAAQLGAGKAA